MHERAFVPACYLAPQSPDRDCFAAGLLRPPLQPASWWHQLMCPSDCPCRVDVVSLPVRKSVRAGSSPGAEAVWLIRLRPPIGLRPGLCMGLLHSNISAANDISGSQTGSQLPQALGYVRLRPAIIAAARTHVRPHLAPSGILRKCLLSSRSRVRVAVGAQMMQVHVDIRN